MVGNEPFDLTNLRQLQREADELAGLLSAAAAAVEAEFVGGDPAGVVEVTIGVDGLATRVRVDAAWRRIAGVAGLGAAVVTALAAATTARLSAWAGGVTSSAGAPSAVADPEPERHAELGDPSSRQSVLAVREVMDLVDDVTARLPELTEAAEAVATRGTVSTNSSRTVRVRTEGGMVSAVDFDDQWLRSADHHRIATGIQEALSASERAAAQARQAAFDAVPGLDRVRRLTASPETLLREIGLLK